MSLAPIIAALAVGVVAIVLAIIFFASGGGRRTQAVFFLILGIVLLIVAAGLGIPRLTEQASGTPLLVDKPSGPVQIRVLAALPIEPWVREAARRFNDGDFTQDGQPVEVQVIAMDGLTALGKFDRDDFGTLGERTRDQLSADELQRLHFVARLEPLRRS